MDGLEHIAQTKRPFEVVDDWPKLISIDRPKFKRLSNNTIPSWAGDFAKALSRSSETPFELSASIVVAVCSLVASKKLIVDIGTGYTEPLALWLLCCLASGNRKSSVVKASTKPLTDWESLESNRISPERMRIKSERHTIEARVKGLRAKAATANDLEDLKKECHELEQTMPEIPQLTALWTSDCTGETLGDLLADNDECIGWFSAEAAIFEILQGRYSKHPNIEIFLKAHAGDPERVNRKTRSTLLHFPRLSIGVTPQPEVLSGLATTPGFRGKGLLARFLYFFPVSPLGYRKFDTSPVSHQITDDYTSGIEKILSWNKSEADNRLHTIHLSDHARELWENFRNKTEVRMRAGEDMEYLTDFAGKLPGTLVRVAGVFHAIEAAGKNFLPWEKEIHMETMIKAENFMNCSIEHSIHAFDHMGADHHLEDARKILAWLRRNHSIKEPRTVRDIFNGNRSRFKKVIDLTAPIDKLVEFGYLRRIERRSETAGRPPSPFLEINPVVVSKWKKSH